MGSSGCLEEIRESLTGRDRRAIPVGELTPAAVALVLVKGPETFSVLFTLRTSHVEQHKGEISFPGGRVDPGDSSLLAAALRETWEEVGISPGDLVVLGEFDDYISITDYHVTPYVVYLDREDYPFNPQPSEVDKILVVPIEHLLDSSSYWNEEYEGRFRSKIHYFRWNNHVIWGLTAGILKDFLAETYGFGMG